MRKVGAFEAKTHLSALLEAVAAGEEIVGEMPSAGAPGGTRRASGRIRTVAGRRLRA